jgi:uncharacterized protein
MGQSDRVLSILLFLSLICVVLQAGAQVQSPSSNHLAPREIDQLLARAKAGDRDAQLDIGRAYGDGIGVPQSDSLAMKWYRAAAEQGNATAQNNVGLMFRSGRGAEENKLEAIKWYRKAAKQGNPNAMFNLGTVYYNGDGVNVDDIAAYAWFLLAQKVGSMAATDAAKRMKEEAGRQENSAFERIGDMYQKGDDLPQNTSEAINWYRKAAENGEARMQIKLVNLLFQNQSMTPTYVEIHQLCEKAASSHFAPGVYCMGLLYDKGLGVEQDFTKAAKWFNEATNLGNGLAAFRLGEMYSKGEGVKQDKISAYFFIRLASSADLPEAKQEKERMEKELTPKEIDKGKTKSIEWTRQHPSLELKGRPLTGN